MKTTRGERFEDARRSMPGNLSLRAVERLSGVPYAIIQALENDNNDRGVSYKEIMKLAEFYNVSVDYLLCITDTPTRDATTQAICQETGLSEKAVEKIQNISRSGDNLTEALTFLIEHREFLRLLYCIRDLNNPEIFKLDDRAGLDYIYRVVHDLQSPKIDAIGSVQYRGSRTFGNIMEDALKQNVGNQKKEV